MGERTPPLRRIVERQGSDEILECGHRQKRKPNPAMRRRCRQCIELRRLSVTLHEKQEVEAGQRCPFCFDEFNDTPDDPATTCKRCGTKLHSECWEENAGCTALGCRENRARVVVRQRAPEPVAAVAAPVAQAPETPRARDGRFVPRTGRWWRWIAAAAAGLAVPLGLFGCVTWDWRVGVLFYLFAIIVATRLDRRR